MEIRDVVAVGIFISLIASNGVLFAILKKQQAKANRKDVQNVCYKTAMEQLHQAVMITDEYGKIIEMNQAATLLFGRLEGQVFNEVIEIIDKETNLPTEDIILTCRGQNREFVLNEAYFKTSFKAEALLVSLRAMPFETANSGVLFFITDETEAEKKREEMVYLSFHDALTGLYNRHFFEAELHRLDTERNLPLSVVMLDVNGLKLTNDAFGHEKGDELLKVVSTSLKETFRSDDIIARWGGDEFVAVLPKLHEQEVDVILKRLEKNLSQQKLDPIQVSVSYGFSQKTVHEDSLKTVLKRAEEMMYRRKLTESMTMRFETIHKIIGEMDLMHKEKTERVKRLSSSLGKALGLGVEELHTLDLVSKMYDIGNFAMDESIINKKEALSDHEKEELKKHSEIGYHLLKSVEMYARLSEIVLSHHERWDGQGYPRKISGDEIPLTSRIISVVDSYEALISHRPYREALSAKEAIEVIEREKGKQFDPKVVDVFLNEVIHKENIYN